MSQQSLPAITVRLILLFCCLTLPLTHWAAVAQTGNDLAEMKRKVSVLVDQNKLTEALPLLEKIVVAEPNDAETHLLLGFALIAQEAITKDEAARKAIRVRARNSFIKAKELGHKEPRIDAMIGGIPPDGTDAASFSVNIKANVLMKEGEAFFAQGRHEEALKSYQEALALDPKLYHAALFSGDVYLHKKDWAQAEAWYQKAILIDPTKETAYRYSATPFMRQGKTDIARERYIEAFITEPYNRFARAGLIQWGQATNTPLAHPKIDIPTNVTFDQKGDAKVNLDAGALLSGKNEGGASWIAYGITRSTWRKEKFAKTFPNEKAYRHSLAEEADALRSVLALAATDKEIKSLSPSLAKLKELENAGLLEAYILLAMPDQGIALDHPAYLRQHRDKLRRYMVEYVVKGGGN